MGEVFELRRMVGGDFTPDEADDLFAPEFSQTTHGFVVGDILYRSSLTDHTKAIATARSTLACGIVIDQPDANTFSILCIGSRRVNIGTHSLGSFGQELWLDQSAAGTFETVEPTSGWYQYLGIVLSATDILWEPSKLAVMLL